MPRARKPSLKLLEMEGVENELAAVEPVDDGAIELSDDDDFVMTSKDKQKKKEGKKKEKKKKGPVELQFRPKALTSSPFSPLFAEIMCTPQLLHVRSYHTPSVTAVRSHPT